jgi:hypothetical protein
MIPFSINAFVVALIRYQRSAARPPLLTACTPQISPLFSTELPLKRVSPVLMLALGPG